ncbi:MAG: helix-turn-helix transcriptional regulator [Chloroflexi bacterium]|nr:helix-turn-helix transcriptional regulator [Chloroflexota bacterium]
MVTRSQRPRSRRRGGGEESDGGGGRQPRLHGELLASSLLAFLRNWPAYGYQLVRELGKAGLPAFNSATVYRTLRQLERSGLVSSFWDASESGPARRMYSLTKAGETFLNLWLDVLTHYQNILQSALDSYENLQKRGKSGGGRPAKQEPKRTRGSEKRGRHA